MSINLIENEGARIVLIVVVFWITVLWGLPWLKRKLFYKKTLKRNINLKTNNIPVDSNIIPYHQTSSRTYDSCNLSDLQVQGFLLGDKVPKDKYPKFVFRIMDDDPSITLLSGRRHGVVMVYYDDNLSTEQIIEQLKTNREYYLKKAGIDPMIFPLGIKLMEIDSENEEFTLYKPTPKDSGFSPYFRYNNTSEPFGKSLDLNTGSTETGLKQYAMKNYRLPHEMIKEYTFIHSGKT